MARYSSILLVDDDVIQIALLTSYFQTLEVETIRSALGPTDALKIMAEHGSEIDLVVTDLQMPQMDGIEFMRHLKGSGFRGKLAIISGVKSDILGHAARLAHMRELNLLGQISKPFTRDALDRVFLRDNEAEVRRKPKAKHFITHQEFAEAMDNARIYPHYQPKVEVESGRVIGAEALARWINPDGSMISPEVFISFAEENGRIADLTFYLFDKVLADIPAFLAVNPDIKIAVNLTPTNIRNMALPDQLFERMNRAGVSAKNLSFEVTEDSILNLDVTTLEVLSRLRVLDLDVAIDDFGTGSSNIQTLRDFPYSELKIDRSFISDALTNQFSRETVLAAVKLAHQKGMNIVAEGVEDVQTWKMLQELGIEHAQGYLLSKAMPAEDYVKFLQQNADGMVVEQEQPQARTA